MWKNRFAEEQITRVFFWGGPKLVIASRTCAASAAFRGHVWPMEDHVQRPCVAGRRSPRHDRPGDGPCRQLASLQVTERRDRLCEHSRPVALRYNRGQSDSLRTLEAVARDAGSAGERARMELEGRCPWQLSAPLTSSIAQLYSQAPVISTSARPGSVHEIQFERQLPFSLPFVHDPPTFTQLQSGCRSS